MFQSSLLNTNLSPFLSWKGKTFGQITSSIQKNENTSTMGGKLLFQPPPLKIYRREIVTKPLKTQSSKISTSIELLQQPGSTLVISDPSSNWTVCDSDCSGTKLTLDTNLVNNRGETYDCCTDFGSDASVRRSLDPAYVAKQRVRSSGMISKKPPSSVTTAPYCTTSSEYLSTRGKTFQQNTFNYFKSGDPLVKPGAPGSQNNKYSINNNGDEYCPKNPGFYVETQFKPANYKYSQDGGVSSSARTTRLNYNTITTNGDLYTKAYGSEVGNALSYGKSSDAYTIKDKIGFPQCNVSCVTTKLNNN